MPRHGMTIHLGILVVLFPLLTAASDRAAIPRSVSPGEVQRVVPIDSRCPTFSWALVADASEYELLIYTLDEGAREVEAAPHTRQTLPGGATTWTPAGGACFTAGESYLWVVRAVMGEKPSAWSEARLFSVSDVPSAGEVAEALRVLEAYQVSRPDQQESAASPADTQLRPQPQRETPSAALDQAQTATGRAPEPGVSLSGSAAIRGSQTDVSGDTLGVVGEVASVDGAGVAAANSAGGVDLLLDGSADSETDTLVSQDSIDRSSGSGETFEIKNSGGGGMTVLIDGVAAVTTATDSDTLGSLVCATDEIAQWDGGSWICVAAPAGDTLASLNCSADQVARWNGSAWECATIQGGDTLGNLSCTDGQVVHFNGAAWVCGQPSLTFVTCNGGGGCSMSCPANTIVWTGGCETTSGSPASVQKSYPTSAGPGMPPTGWQCNTVNPIGGAQAVGYLYCVSQ